MRYEAAEFYEGDLPLIATAIHDGHELRPDVASLMALDGDARLREEDPFTADWTGICPTRVAVLRSRFEFDVNRSRHQAVYLTPADAWGLKVWAAPPPPVLVLNSLLEYDRFYWRLRRLIQRKISKYGGFVLLDLHSYNHRRDGPNSAPAPARDSPEVNVGTGSVKDVIWRPLVDRLIHDLSAYNFLGRGLDVRENVRFQGGYMPQWVNGAFGSYGCAIAIETKKFFMDEWTGHADIRLAMEVKRALASTLPGLLEEFERVCANRLERIRL